MQVYTSEFTHAIDGQRRVAIPKEWRPAAADESVVFYLIPARDHTIHVLPEAVFMDRIVAKAMKVALSDGEMSEALARMGAKASKCVCGRQGRITLTPELMKHAALEGQAHLIGSITFIQIRRPETWAAGGMNEEEMLDQIRKLEAIGEE